MNLFKSAKLLAKHQQRFLRHKPRHLYNVPRNPRTVFLRVVISANHPTSPSLTDPKSDFPTNTGPSQTNSMVERLQKQLFQLRGFRYMKGQVSSVFCLFSAFPQMLARLCLRFCCWKCPKLPANDCALMIQLIARRQRSIFRCREAGGSLKSS